MSQSSKNLIGVGHRSLWIAKQAFPEHPLRQQQPLHFARRSSSMTGSITDSGKPLAALAQISPSSISLSSVDNAGNTLATARSITLSSNPQTFNDFVGAADPTDYYKFTLANPQNFNLSLTGLTADADIQLLNSTGGLIQSSEQAGTTSESMRRSLDAGTYYIRVLQFSGDTNYALEVSTAGIVSIAATDATAAEVAPGSTPNPGQFTISRTGSTAEPLTVNYTVGGTATQSIDYSTLTGTASNIGSVIIPAGQTSATIPVNVIDDNLQEGPETIALTLTSGAYVLGSAASATVSILDSDSPNVANPTVGTASPSSNSKINALLAASRTFWNTSQNGRKITYSFYKSSSGSYYGSELVSELSEAVKTNVRNILSMVSSYINVDFVEVADTPFQSGVLRYMFSNLGGGGGYAYAYTPSGNALGGDVHLSPNNESDPINRFSGSPGNHGYKALIHETFHALGLKHSGNYEKSTAGEVFLPGSEDNSTNTVMTYNSAGSNPITPMAYDIQALQYLYGSRSNNATDTTYRFTSVHSYSVGDRSFGSTTTQAKQSLWDSGGMDTVDLSGLASASSYRFDLRPGGMLTTRSGYNTASYVDRVSGGTFTTSQIGTTIAFKTLIENVVNSGGSDAIFANSAANRFRGYSRSRATGQDTYFLTSASDVLELGDFSLSNLTPVVSGRDLTIGLGSSRNVRIIDYYGTDGTTSNSMRIQLGSAAYVYNPTVGWQAVA